MSRVQLIEIAADDAAQRLDRWFRRRFPEVSQGRIEKMCRKGEIRVDGGRVKASTRLEAGQSVRVPPLPDGPPPTQVPRINESDSDLIRNSVIWQDDHLIALNKPPGLPTQGGSKQARHVDGLAEALKDGHPDKPRLLHRLDKDTSGVLLLARSRGVAQTMGPIIRSRQTRKIYWAAVAGVPRPRMGTIRYGLLKAGRSGEGEKMRCVHPDEVDHIPDAKSATTNYAVLEGLAGRASWVALEPVTGRTHQLRAHMAVIGHPIAGDGKYGGSGQENLGDGWGAGLGGGISRKLHLHARSIFFSHPVTGVDISLTAKLPKHMAETWTQFDWSANDVPADPFREEEY